MHEIVFHRRYPVPPQVVWDAWGTSEGAQGFFAPECHIDAQADGLYEVYFFPENPPGQRGAEGMRVLSADPPNFLSFTWNAPPSIPTIRLQRTWVEIRIFPADDGCRMVFINGGYGEGDDWAAAHDYFVRAWGDVVLPRLDQYIEGGPIEWAALERRT